MGSGSSKDKNSNTKTPRNDIKKLESVSSKQQKENLTNSRTVDTVSHSESGHKQQNGNTKKIDHIDNNNKPTKQIPQPFDDSDDDDGEDLLRDEWRNKNAKNNKKNNSITENYSNNKRTWQPPEPPKEEYPETYAQKMQREQYKHEQLLRQKTIYRDPEEWEFNDQFNLSKLDTVSNASQQSFDVTKFKEVNKTMPKTDIFGPISNNDYSYGNQNDTSNDFYQPSNHDRKRSVPKYDITEEELMADIEKYY